MRFMKNNSRFAKIMSFALSAILLLTTLNIGLVTSVFATTDYNPFTVSVITVDGEFIEGASVTIVPLDESIEIAELSPVLTNDEGDAVFETIYDYFSENSEITEFEATYTVTAENYQEVSIDEQDAITVTAQGNICVVMKDSVNPTIKDISGNPDDWTNTDVTLEIVSDDTDIVAYTLVGWTNDWQSEPTFVITENGRYRFKVKDSSGNESDIYSVNVSKIDKNAPDIDDIVIDPTSWTKDKVIMEVKASDDGCGVAEYKMDNGEWQKEPFFEISDSKEHRFYVRDALGNDTLFPVTKSADNFDNTKPEITDIEYDDKIWSNTSITYKVIADDNSSGVVTYGIILKEDNDNTDDITWSDSSEFEITDTELYSFFVKDGASNISNPYNMSEPAKIDKESPKISKVKPSTEDWTNEPVSFSVEASDEGGSGISGYRMDGGEWQASNVFENIADDKEHRFEVIDNAGNVSEVSKKAAENYDATPPVLSVTPSTTQPTNKEIIITVTANDNNSGINAYRIDGGEWQASNLFGISDNKEHVFEAVDNAGNISVINEDAKYTSKNYDAEAPELVWVNFYQNNDVSFTHMINFLTFGVFFNETVTVKINGEDVEKNDSNATGIKSYSIYLYDENSTEIYREENNIENEFVLNNSIIENFKGTIKVIISDNAGNQTEKIDITTANSDLKNFDYFMLENDVPVISEITPPNNSILKNDFNFEFTVTDIVQGKYFSGLNAVMVTVNDTVVLLDDFSEIEVKEKAYSLAVNTAAKTVNGQTVTNWNKGTLEIKVNAYDNSGNAAIEMRSVVYLDQNSPIIKGFDFSLSDNIDVEKDTAKNLYNAVLIEDYGFYFKETVVVTVYAEDLVGDNETVASGLKSITYKAVDINGEVKYSGVDIPVSESNNSVSFEIRKEENFKGQIYAYATDNVGNTPNDCVTCTDDKVVTIGEYKGYSHPYGSIVESIAKHEATSSIVIIAPEKVGTQNKSYNFDYTGDAEIADADKAYDDAQLVPLYNSAGSLDFEVDVTDSYSGIRYVKWTVIEDGNAVVEKMLAVSNNGVLSGDTEGWRVTEGLNGDNLVYSLNGQLSISGNHNDMVLLVELTDRAGNTSYDYYVFGIDSVKPLIDVRYDDEKSENDEEFIEYFRTDRTAEITITERNFRAENVVAVITKDGTAVEIVDLNSTSVWKENVNEANLDETTYTAMVTYSADGDYTFDISFTDNAENKNETVDYGSSIAPVKFTVDKTIPTVTVVYNNNSSANGNYYNADRTATITVTEHNFVADRVEVLESSPSISTWESSGDVHTATITYKNDGNYKFDIEITDMAGNSIEDFAAQEFIIDKTAPVVVVSGIADQSANNDEGDIGFTVTATDENFDVFTPNLSAVVMADGGFEVKMLKIGKTESISNGKKYTVSNIDTDGVYGVSCVVTDKAGNAFTSVLLQDANGKAYTKNCSSGDKMVSFSVNREGSVFTLDSYTQALVEGYYTKDVMENITVIEINADKITQSDVMLNGKVLEKDNDYIVTLDNSAGTWYRYSYSIDKTLFENEGEYNVVVSSTDKATNKAFSDVKNVSVKFVVDRTAPVVTVGGLKTNGRYQVDKQVVTLAPTDDGGSLSKLIVRTVDENGNVLAELLNLSGEELLKAVEAGEITFELGEGLYQNVQIICEDCAGNIVGVQADEIYSNVTISPNAFMIFWANKPLRWGTIAGIILLTAAAIFLIVLKKRKK